MRTPKHTPGPWRSYNMSRNKILKQWHIQRDDCRHDIALVSLDVPVDDRERVANLIAAAPAMYEALRTIKNQSLGPDWTAEQAVAFVKQYAKETLAQAEGKP